MSLMDRITSTLNTTKKGLTNSVKRFKNKDFLDAVVAGCALVAAADGNIDNSEKEKMIGFIQRSEELKVFETDQVIMRFNHFVDGFGFSHNVGAEEAYRAIAKVKDKEAARILIAVCCAIGTADGNFDDKEKTVVREICLRLDVNPSEYLN